MLSIDGINSFPRLFLSAWPSFFCFFIINRSDGVNCLHSFFLITTLPMKLSPTLPQLSGHVSSWHIENKHRSTDQYWVSSGTSLKINCDWEKGNQCWAITFHQKEIKTSEHTKTYKNSLILPSGPASRSIQGLSFHSCFYASHNSKWRWAAGLKEGFFRIGETHWCIHQSSVMREIREMR